MTLVEVIIVLAIAAGMMSLAVLSLGAITNSRLNSEAMQLSGAMRLVYGRSAINGLRYQLVIDIDKGEYWAECAEKNVLVAAASETTDPNRRDRARGYRDDDKEANPFGLGRNSGASMQSCSEPLFEKRTLRSGIRFEQVLTPRYRKPATAGQVQIGYFPNGFVERSIIWIGETDEDGAASTVTIDPMSGRVRTFGGRLDVPKDFFEVQEER